MTDLKVSFARDDKAATPDYIDHICRVVRDHLEKAASVGKPVGFTVHGSCYEWDNSTGYMHRKRDGSVEIHISIPKDRLVEEPVVFPFVVIDDLCAPAQEESK